MKSCHMAEQWESFRAVLPGEMPSEKLLLLQMTFYAGAVAFDAEQEKLSATGATGDVTAEELIAFDALREELLDFFAACKAGLPPFNARPRSGDAALQRQAESSGEATHNA